MKHFLVIGLAALAIAAFAPQTHAGEPQKKAAPAVHHVVPKARPATRGFHPTPGHAAVRSHPMHAALPNRNAHFGDPGLRRPVPMHRVEAMHRDEHLRNDRFHAQAVRHEELRRDERLRAEERHDGRINARDARLSRERAGAQSASDNSSADSGSDADSDSSAGDSSSDSGSSPTDAKVQALGTLLNLLQGGGKK